MTPMGDAERRDRAAARRARATLYRTSLLSSNEDPQPIFGAEAVALVQRLTEESWSLSGAALPTYTRAQVPWRFEALLRNKRAAGREQDAADIKALEAVRKRDRE
jgi:hypothetical protein